MSGQNLMRRGWIGEVEPVKRGIWESAEHGLERKLSVYKGVVSESG